MIGSYCMPRSCRLGGGRRLLVLPRTVRFRQRDHRRERPQWQNEFPEAAHRRGGPRRGSIDFPCAMRLAVLKRLSGARVESGVEITIFGLTTRQHLPRRQLVPRGTVSHRVPGSLRILPGPKFASRRSTDSLPRGDGKFKSCHFELIQTRHREQIPRSSRPRPLPALCGRWQGPRTPRTSEKYCPVG